MFVLRGFIAATALIEAGRREGQPDAQGCRAARRWVSRPGWRRRRLSIAPIVSHPEPGPELSLSMAGSAGRRPRRYPPPIIWRCSRPPACSASALTSRSATSRWRKCSRLRPALAAAPADAAAALQLLARLNELSLDDSRIKEVALLDQRRRDVSVVARRRRRTG